MAKALSRNRNGSRSGSTKYDAPPEVLSQTYGALADLRRELSDSKSAVAEREELLNSFSTCADRSGPGCCSKITSRSSPFRAGISPLPTGGRLAGYAGQRAPRRTRVSLFTRSPLASHGTFAHANLNRFAQVEESRTGAKAHPRIGALAVSPKPVHLIATRDVAGHLPAQATRRMRHDFVWPCSFISCVSDRRINCVATRHA